MPTYGQKKIKDMIKSILPSKHRKSARDNKAEIKRTARTAANIKLHLLVGDEAGWDYGDEDLDAYPDYEINSQVRSRRDGDKIGPIMRWAPKVTQGAHDARVAQLRAVLPKNTIGEHALGHVQNLDEFRNPRGPHSFWPGYASSPTRPNRAELEAAQLRDLLAKKPWLHATLNSMLRKAHQTHRVETGKKCPYGTTLYKSVGPSSARMLKGAHDLVAFLADLRKASDWGSQRKVEGAYHPEWRNALLEFFRRFG